MTDSSTETKVTIESVSNNENTSKLSNGTNGLTNGHVQTLGQKNAFNNGINNGKKAKGKSINGYNDLNGNLESGHPNKTEATKDSDDKETRCCGQVRDFFHFLIFRVQWIKLIFEIVLAVGFFWSAPVSIYRFFAEFWTHSWWIMVATWVWAFTLTTFGGIGLSVGAHRLWSHHAFKAKWPLKLMLTLMYTLAAENSVYHYVKHHRAHHKYLDTHGDPQNINRGFWYAQVGYRVLKLHPQYREKVKTISYDDILQDPFVMFQHKYYVPLVIIVAFAIPVAIPVLVWNEALLNSFLIAGCSKSFLVIHMHGLVGSVCHSIGKRPYNKRISATDNGLLQIITAGEAYHNFHHTFPYDYSISELGKTLNTSKMFIDFMAWLGLAYDLRLAGEEFIKKTKLKAAEENPICFTWI